MVEFQSRPLQEVQSLFDDIQEHYLAQCAEKLNINMARGVLSSEQLDLSNGLFEQTNFIAQDGTDCRNYMGQQGLPEARKLFSNVLGVPPEQVVVDGNSSLALMHDCLSYAWRSGTCDSALPWGKLDDIAFLCPVPGYDRHFSLCESFGIRLIPVDLRDDGPDIEQVLELVKDPAVKGMWCIPKYSNPTGTIYSDSVIEALARMETAALDFRLFWDDAYTLHHLTEERVAIANITELCERHGHPNRAFVFASTSKMTFAGSGLALFGSSPKNIAWWLRHVSFRSVGPDKINQLRHVSFLKDFAGLEDLMEGHRRILAPRFDAVKSVFQERLSSWKVATWSSPLGGYFISLNCMPGTAKRVVELAKKAGVQVTAAGAAYPYGRDPHDSHLRIAPSSPTLEELKQAANLVSTCVLVAACEHRLGLITAA
ncbi:aminotransferase class I/II-fold pyridoxal phosphate-dependent enzyme [Pseudomonas sp. CR3202]|uniref:aminotransferase class I/II-fold pyridoxal phosphate-dependent enzyme n=1 Tax=Pseudomonas sp. CR3202 TaxID=3351532 RepID=UPI003BF399F8